VVTCLAEPTIESAQQVMKHPAVRLLVVTGGGAVVKAAMASGKRAICAGPGNPQWWWTRPPTSTRPDATFVLGASTDNNIICTDEKEVLCVAMVADGLIKAMTRSGAGADRPGAPRRAREGHLHRAARAGKPAHVNKDLIGKNADVILSRIGMSVPPPYASASSRWTRTTPSCGPSR